MPKKKLTRGQKAWATRKANQLKASREVTTRIGIIKEPVVSDLGSTMVLLEKAIDALIIRINLQTQRIKDMM